MLDADETLAPGSEQAIRAAMAQAHGGFLLPLENELGEGRRHSTRLLRLFRRHPGIRYEGRVHEQVSESLLALGLSIGDCPALILHNGYLPERVAERGKHERNLGLLDLMRQEAPADPYAPYQQGKTLLAAGRASEAVVPLREALASLAGVAVPRTYPFYPKVFLHLASALEADGSPDEAPAVLTEGGRLLPEDASLALRHGLCARERGLDQEAFEAFERCLLLEGPERARAAALGADMLWEDGQRLEALARYRFAAHEASPGAAYEKVLGLVPDHLPSHLALATLSFEQGDWAAARRSLIMADRLDPGRPDVSLLLAACRKQGI